MRECLCCKWGEVDDPPEGWIEKPISMKIFFHVSALDGGASPLDAVDARKRILSMASDRLEKGLCPGVVAWCEKCERVTPLVRRGWSDAGEAILDMLEEARRFDVMYRVERSGGRHTATKEGGKNFTKERARKDVGKDAGNDAGKEAGKEDQPGGEGLRGEPQRDRRATPLSQLQGDLMFWPVRAAPGNFFESSYSLFHVGFKPRRRTENEREVVREAQSISLEPLQEIRCRGGVTLVIQSFRPQRPRASVSTGIRKGLVECEVRRDSRQEEEEEEADARRVPAGGEMSEGDHTHSGMQALQGSSFQGSSFQGSSLQGQPFQGTQQSSISQTPGNPGPGKVVDSKGEVRNFNDMTPVLQHIKSLEEANQKLRAQMEELMNKNNKLSERTRHDMQKVLDTVMAKFGDALESNDQGMKDRLLTGMKRLVENSAEDNGVWRMMVCASNLYERQTHELDQLRLENNELKERVNGTFSSEAARVGDKRRATDELERPPAIGGDIWNDFAMAFKEEGI
ncbi:hypothetical protein GUITHDRAFT_118991 [Guillardia theta CCMP2712]|uniref:Uncharacterized protein n=1 Tax=Guillardia theta (strain CCMP2712) TaxID=905079 RepID=L1IG78_GUITC|nr:hypothetical protein GUITHDRAFT_118991 [Guillardia theta CCMP2712]EKX34815.1 hypothetical protein GUITHDRAFT_118991 [Guillardia theta CCMP2712]|eukprot:XP_005821795.1 hypothetical protein GUITHDRAFT_118991 [Guillardia theta CCMP2712]